MQGRHRLMEPTHIAEYVADARRHNTPTGSQVRIFFPATCDHRDDWGEWLGRWQKDRCGMEAYRCAHCHALLPAQIDGSGDVT